MIKPSRPFRAPDIVLRHNGFECEVELWIEENLFCITGAMSNDVSNDHYSGPLVSHYIESTLKRYPAEDVRCVAILEYYCEQELLKELFKEK